jgi:hypothetical protein
MPCCIHFRRTLRLSLREAVLGAPGKSPTRQRRMTKNHIWQRVVQSYWETASCRQREFEAPPFVCEGGEEGEDAMARRSLVLSDSAGIDNLPQEVSRLAMGCCYIGMKMSVVFVSGAQTWQKIRTGAEDAIFHSPHRGQRTSGAYASCC